MENTVNRLGEDLPVPIVPDDILTRFHVAGISDTRFSRCARLLQSIWRERRGLESGVHKPKGRRSRRLGSLLAPGAARTGTTFASPEIARMVRHEVAYREYGALIDERRLWANLLSSQTLTFNLFGAAKLDLDFASRLFARLLPNDVAHVQHVGFEHSPGRGDPRYLSDYTAFDAFLRATGPNGEPVFVGIEVKYAESMQRPERADVGRLRELASQCNIFREADLDALLAEPFAQLTAEHLLARLCAEQLGPEARAVFVVISPIENREAAGIIECYRAMLVQEELSVSFQALSLESVVQSITEVGEQALADYLTERYLDLTPIHNLIAAWEPDA